MVLANPTSVLRKAYAVGLLRKAYVLRKASMLRKAYAIGCKAAPCPGKSSSGASKGPLLQ